MTDTVVGLKNITKQFGDVLAVDNVSLQIREGEFFSLLGPSGCGKTTTLRMIAGFEMPQIGEIYIKGEPVTHLPPFRRNVNTVFQDYALFPHMTVAQNVGFGLEMDKLPEVEIRQRVEDTLRLVQLPQMGDRRPSHLSGGQQQRVALARAIVKRPDVLLLDEPLAALDLKLRQAMRFELKELQHQLGTTFIYVTHDQEEAMTMSDRIAVMNHGHVLQIGTPIEVYDHSADHFVADFIGETNFIDCRVISCNGETATVLIGDEIKLEVACDQNAAADQPGTVVIRPEKIDLHMKAGNDGQETAFVPGIVENMVWIGTDTRFTVKLAGKVEVVVRHQNMRLGDPLVALRRGEPVYLSWQKMAARLITS